MAALGQQPIWVVDTPATSDPFKFTIFANKGGKTTLTATDRAGTAKATLEVVAGTFDYHPGMKVDLIADICRGTDSFKKFCVAANAPQCLCIVGRRSPHSDQHQQQSKHLLAAGRPQHFLGSKGHHHDLRHCREIRAEQVFPIGKVLAPTADWYRVGAIHEPLSSRITNRKQVKYRPERVEALRGQIVRALTDGNAVRVGVLDDPVTSRMTPENGNLVAYRAGGHTVLIVGCTNNGQEFLYIDPWTGGSMRNTRAGSQATRSRANACRLVS